LHFGQYPDPLAKDPTKASDYQTETAAGHRFSVGPANFLCHSRKKMPDLTMQDLSTPGLRTRKTGMIALSGSEKMKA
jgi:hypothetical protein